MPEGQKSVLPDVPEVIVIDIALGEEVPVDVGAGADAAVDEDGGYVHAGVAEVADVADLLLVSAQIALAAEGGFHGAALLPPGLDKFHQRDEFIVRQVHVRILRRPADGNDGENAPLHHAERLQLVVQCIQLGDVSPVDAADHVEIEAGLLRGDGDGPLRPGETAGAAAHPVVAVLESVQTDSQRTHAGSHQLAVHGLVVEPAVGDHAPAYAPLPDGTPHFGDVGAKQRLAARQHDCELGRAFLYGNRVERPQEIVQRHVDFRDNAPILDKIVDITRQIMADTTSRVEKIQVIGLASVEGPQRHNMELSKGRAEALKRYVQERVNTPDDLYECISGGEAWTELRDQINDTPSEYREQMLDIIDNEPNLDKREAKLKALDGGKAYAYLRDNILSDQRNSGYVRIYYDYVPDAAAAAINKASELLRQTKYSEALQMLRTVQSDERAQNALGVALYMTGEKDEALKCFERAAANGNAEAKRNLEQLK